jgi:hypothetical protein
MALPVAGGGPGAGAPGTVVTPSADLVLNNRDLVIRDAANRERTRLDAQSGDWRGRDQSGKTIVLIEHQGRNLFLGGNGRGGDLVLLPGGAATQDLSKASVHLDGDNGTQTIGGGGAHGRLVVKNGSGKQRIFLSGETADLILGQEGGDGDIIVRNASGVPKIKLDGASGGVQASTIQAGQINGSQILSNHSSSGPSQGIDSASVYIESNDPAIGLRDTTNGNTNGWYVQSSSDGRLLFSTGTTSGLNKVVFVLNPNGALCLGACQ